MAGNPHRGFNATGDPDATLPPPPLKTGVSLVFLWAVSGAYDRPGGVWLGVILRSAMSGRGYPLVIPDTYAEG